METTEELAIAGGDPAVTIKEPEEWERPVQEETELLTELLEDGEISGAGRGLPASFEDDFREYTGAEYCLTVDHGSTALESAFYAVGVGPGDEVITPTAGYIGAYAGALHLGARPVFCEIDPETLLVDPRDVEQRITDRTAAIAVIHWNGRVCDLDALEEISERYDVPIVEDAAHAHASRWNGEHISSIGDIACYSLQGVAPHGKPMVFEIPEEIGAETRDGSTKEINLPDHYNEVTSPVDEERDQELIRDLSWSWNFLLPDIDLTVTVEDAFGNTEKMAFEDEEDLTSYHAMFRPINGLMRLRE